jgi:serine/threonine protein kinase
MSGQRPNDDALIGQTIAGRYRITSRLKPGGMGVAFRALDEQADVPVVIKMPRERTAEDPGFFERFRREAKFLQGLNHPHVVPIIGVGERHDRPFIVMRYLPGGSLSDRRFRDADGKPQPNPPGMMKLWLPAVADALDYVNGHGVVHRDVKPANIFFDAHWGAFLGDFGIAKIVAESQSFVSESTLTAANVEVGTTEYMGPEHFSPGTKIDSRADQYSLAVTVYEWISGLRPFRGETAHVVVEILTHQVPTITSSRQRLPASLVGALGRGLAKNPDERFQTCGQFAAAVLQEVPDVPVDTTLVRLLCPCCFNVVILTKTRAGQVAGCPSCKASLRIAEDLSGLWPVQENSSPQGEGTFPSLDFAPTPSTSKSSGSKSRSRGRSSQAKSMAAAHNRAVRVIFGLLAAAAVVLAVVLFREWQATTEEWAFREARRLIQRSSATTDRWKRGHEAIGRYYCLVERDWREPGLDAFAKSEHVGFSECALRELDAMSRPGNAGRWLEVAGEWWKLQKKTYIQIYDIREKGRRVLNPDERLSLKLHAKDLWRRAFAGNMGNQEREMGRKIFDADPKFQRLVQGLRP